MFHDDLKLYKNKYFRSSSYIENILEEIEEKLIFQIGLTENSIFSIRVESDNVYFFVTKKSDIIFKDTIKKTFKHCLNSLYDFSINIIIESDCLLDKPAYGCAYSFARNTNDEGNVDFRCKYNLNVQNYLEFKNYLILNLCLELQYAINRNVFWNDINKDTKKADIDARYELIKTYSGINSKSFKDSLNILIKDKKIPSNIYIELLNLEKDLKNEQI